jgi:hypothetical protein
VPIRNNYKIAETADLRVGVVAAGATAPPATLVEIFAVRSFSDSGSETTIEFATFDRQGTDELITNRRWSINCTAFEIAGSNPGLALVKTAMRSTGAAAILYFEFEDQDGDGVKGFATVKSPSRRREVDQPYEISWQFGVLGDLYELDETITTP